MDVSVGAGDVSLLLGLSEEVLVHIVKLARFTLTDIGHLRATCKRLCDFLDRIRDTVVNDSVVGDLSQYRPYGYWDIDLAAKSGHLEVIQLLHDDEVKRGRVPRCSNESIKAALARGDLEVFVFIVCNRREVFSDGVPYPVRTRPFVRLSREHILALLEKAPSFISGHGCVDAIVATIRRGDESLACRLLAAVADGLVDERIVGSVLASASDNVLGLLLQACSDRGIASDTVTMALVRGAIYSGSPAALDRALRVAPYPVRDMDSSTVAHLAEMACKRGSDAVLTLLRELGAKCSVAFGSRERIGLCLADGARVTSRALLKCLLCSDYDAAAFASAHLAESDVLNACRYLVCYGNVEALRWMKSQKLLSGNNWGRLSLSMPPSYPALESLRGECDRGLQLPPLSPFVLTYDLLDFVLSLRKEASGDDADWQPLIAGTLFASAFACGDLRVLRHLCERVDVLAVFSHPAACKVQRTSINAVVERGQYDVVAYLIDVNARIAPVFDTPLARDPGSFDPVSRPFNLADALETAVKSGHYRLARMIDRRLPGMRASLSAAVSSRRFRLFRWVLGRDPTASKPEQLGRAFLEAVARGSLDFVNWFEENHPNVVRQCAPKLKSVLTRVPDARFLRAIFEKFSFAFAPGEVVRIPLTYDALLLQRSFGLKLVDCHNLWVDNLVGGGRRDILQAAIDTEFPLRGLPACFGVDFGMVTKLRERNPPLLQWLEENAGKFKAEEGPY